VSEQNGQKKTTSISLDADLKQRAQSNAHINLSGLCNDLLEEYFASGSSSKARLEAKRDRLLQQREHLETELAHLNEEIETVEAQLAECEERDRHRDKKVEELAEQLPDDVDAENPAVQNWATKLDLTPAQLTDEIRAQRGEA